MRLTATPPPGWEHRITSALLSRRFADCMATLGWCPLYASDDSDSALVLVRRLPVPGIRTWTMRAKVYLNRGSPGFVRELRHALAEAGAACAVIGDPIRPLPWHLRARMPDGAVIEHHRIVHDVSRDDEVLLAGMEPDLRRNIRRAPKAGVSVTEVTSERDLRAFCALNLETADRIRGRQLVAALPDAFFEAVLREMVTPSRDAVILLARARDVPLAGALLFRNDQHLTYYHGVSTRDRALSRLQGPSCLFWEAMRLARAMGLRYFDHGAVTVTDDPAHPHYSVYEYKRRFGGQLESCASAQLVLSPTRHAFQQRIMMPVWKRLYPLYLRLARAGEATAATVAGAVMLA